MVRAWGQEACLSPLRPAAHRYMQPEHQQGTQPAGAGVPRAPMRDVREVGCRPCPSGEQRPAPPSSAGREGSWGLTGLNRCLPAARQDIGMRVSWPNRAADCG